VQQVRIGQIGQFWACFWHRAHNVRRRAEAARRAIIKGSSASPILITAED
jgi:hypothetical protein